MNVEESSGGEKRCLVCSANSGERILLCGLEHNKEVWVCVRCLPMLIHGVH